MGVLRIPRFLLFMAALPCFIAANAAAQPLETTLSPQSVAEFEAYAHTVEAQLMSSPAIELSPELMAKLQTGEVLAKPSSRNPVEVYSGLIHDWTGTVFFPHATLPQVLHVLQDFDHHASIYPDMTKSRLLQRSENHVSGVWRLERRNGPVHFALDLYDEADYRQVAQGRWLCFAHAKKIVQVLDAGTPKEKILPEGEGFGFLWRLYGYWTLEARNGGVLAQCRTLSLSRSVPAAVGWIVSPFVKEQPRESLVSTLRATRGAVDRRVNRPETATERGR